MSEFTPQQEDNIEVSLANLNERVSAAASEYLSYLESDPESDVISNLQDALVDMIAIGTVAYTALDKLSHIKEQEQ